MENELKMENLYTPVNYKLFIAVIEDATNIFNRKIWTLAFHIPENMQNPERALRNAVQEYLKTPVGKETVEYNCGGFNWGDAMLYIDNSLYEKYGLHLVNSTEILLNHDESLN